VVADEVRTSAETSEKSAKQIQDLVGQIQADVKTIAGGINTLILRPPCELTGSSMRHSAAND
jgi:methyl-accepting chemotaxis protein